MNSTDLQIIREAFERLVRERRAVSKPHREAIAVRIILAARAGVTSVDDLVARARQTTEADK